jgi:homoaconitate hydratase
MQKLRKQNLIEKIVQKYVNNKNKVYSGDYVSIKPKHILTHDNSAAVINKFNKLPIKNIKNPTQPVFVLDHNVQDNSEQNLKQYQMIEDFAKQYGISFYPKGRGIGILFC